MSKYSNYKQDFDESCLDSLVCSDYLKKLLRITNQETYFFKYEDEKLILRQAGNHFVLYHQYLNSYRANVFIEKEVITDFDKKVNKRTMISGPGLLFCDSDQDDYNIKYNSRLTINSKEYLLSLME